MRDEKGRFKEGYSGNPGGKVKKTITSFAEAAMGDDGKEELANLVRHAVLTGTVKFPDGRTVKLDFKQWQGFVEWLFDRLDGKPMQPVQTETIAQVDLTTEDYAEAMAGLEEWKRGRN